MVTSTQGEVPLDDEYVPAVIIVGGGPAGASTAIALRRLGIGPVCLIESGDHSAFRLGEKLRPTARLSLEKLGLIEDFEAEGHEQCLGRMVLWGDGAVVRESFEDSPDGPGWHLDRPAFDAFLLHRAEQLGTHVLRNHHVTDCVASTTGARVTVASPKGDRTVVPCEIVVDATGPRARVARMMGADSLLDDTLICLSAVLPVDPNHPMDSWTRLEAAPEGWWYAARLPRDRMVIALNSDAHSIAALGLETSDVWLAALRRTQLLMPLRQDWTDMAVIRPSIRRDTVFSGRLQRTHGASWFAVGDAAARMDPLFTEGLSNALADGLELAQVISRHLLGDGTPAVPWERRITSRHTAYLELRRALYERETRWPDALFWKARGAANDRALAKLAALAG